MSPTLNKQASKERCAVEFATRKKPKTQRKKSKALSYRGLCFFCTLVKGKGQWTSKMSKQDYIQLRTLTDQFYVDNTDLKEALDGSNDGKVRGYGIVVIDLDGLVFGIPLRSHLNHKFGFVSERSEGVKKGLDYTKALLIQKDEYVSRAYKIPASEFIHINDNKDKIQEDFNKFVSRYIEAHNKKDVNILRNYRYSTLKNYHKELGLED